MDSMKSTPPEQRVLEIRTERVPGAHPHLTVTVLDKGEGFEPAQKDKLFDSLYTTKNEGLGLGLSIARSIVRLHGGAIWAENRLGGGTAFAFTLPFKGP
jgi:signal transduction histidine kinase